MNVKLKLTKTLIIWKNKAYQNILDEQIANLQFLQEINLTNYDSENCKIKVFVRNQH